MPQAASTGQSCTHCNGGGVVVTPWSSRPSSALRARCSASRPGVDSRGATPSRQTFRQLSMVCSPVLGRCSPGCCSSLLGSLCLIPTVYKCPCCCQVFLSNFFCFSFEYAAKDRKSVV